MATLERRRLKRALLEKGFREESGHRGHTYYRLYDGEKKTLVLTQISEGSANRNLADDNVRKTYKQMHLTKAQLLRFVECTLSGSDYVEIAREKLAEQGKKL